MRLFLFLIPTSSSTNTIRLDTSLDFLASLGGTNVCQIGNQTAGSDSRTLPMSHRHPSEQPMGFITPAFDVRQAHTGSVCFSQRVAPTVNSCVTEGIKGGQVGLITPHGLIASLVFTFLIFNNHGEDIF